MVRGFAPLVVTNPNKFELNGEGQSKTWTGGTVTYDQCLRHVSSDKRDGTELVKNFNKDAVRFGYVSNP